MFEKLTRSRYMTENVTDELIRLENLVKIYAISIRWRIL